MEKVHPDRLARCNTCSEITELELRKDYEGHSEWRLGAHYGYPCDPSGCCNGYDTYNYSELSKDEIVEYTRRVSNG